uniref:class I SAM-dependent methyltransferase n=1 Tax=Klebsiella pneumoniae TaxID=573 RepID=UPI003C73086B
MQSYTPPRGTGSTKDYDRAIRLWAREKRWRAAMLAALAPKAGETVVDVGCGTGSFALMLKQAEPRTQVIGLDPDAEALDIARHKAAVRRAGRYRLASGICQGRGAGCRRRCRVESRAASDAGQGEGGN